MKTYTLFWLCCGLSIFSFGQSITNIEYYFNTDPGFGNATNITANTNSGDLTQALSIAVPTDAVGFNTLFIRTQDNNSIWSLYDKAIFYITDFNPASVSGELVAAEYYINTDPGFGNATTISVNANTGSIDQDLVLPLPTDLVGFNTIFIRVQDDLGVWGLYDKAKFYITDFDTSGGASEITSAEYYFDTDPGFGNASTLAVNTNTGTLDQTFNISIGALPVGFHNLYIRVQDDLDIWSLYDEKLFYVNEDQTISEIVAAEYFYDTDPGIGNGTATTITPTGNEDEFTIDLATTDISCDFHDFYIRLQNADGVWSLYDYREDVEVFDNANPTIVVFPDITAELDASGQASITIADVDNGTFDDCELVSVVLNQAQFDYTCTNLGENTVTITATDAEDKVSTQEVTITVVDLINPVANSQDITVQLDANGSVTITADAIDNNSSDNCSIDTRVLDKSTFTCADLGANTVTLTVTDQSGNPNSTTATVTLEDSINPTAIAQDITVQLDATGNATLTADAIDQSTDNCSITDRSIDISSFDCNDLGANTVTLSVEDQSGNMDNTTATVTVVDSIDPVASVQNITVQLDSNGAASINTTDIENGSTDNCTIASSSIDVSSFTCDDLGDNTVILTVTDQSGNMGSATATITVEDNISPTAVAQNITVQLDASGNASIANPTDLDDGSGDNCSTLDFEVDISNFNCNDLGANTVTLTVTDLSGNSDDAIATVTVVDSIDPVASVQNITVQLDSNGAASISTTDIENGSTDNCTIAGSSIDVSSFTCDDLGDNTVTLTVTDQSGNMGSATATVTVEDNISPTAIAQDITVQLDASGNASIGDPTDLDGGSGDNCSTLDFEVDISNFTCNDLGANTVTLSVIDLSGNSDDATATVTVVDSIDPTVQGQDITVDLAGASSITITAGDLDTGSTDNCSFTLSIDVDTFTAPGDYPVVLTITDSAGNDTSVTVTVTITDSTLSIGTNTLTVNDIEIYPVPTRNKLFIKTELELDGLLLFDLNGKLLLKINKPSKELDISNLSDGIYYLKLKVGQSEITKRVIKNR